VLGVAGYGCSSATPSVFETGSPEELRLAEEVAMNYLDVEFAPEGLTRRNFSATSVVVDELAMAHTRVQQTQDGVPVFGGELIVHLRSDGSPFAVTDSHVRGIGKGFDVVPKIPADLVPAMVVGGYDCPECLTAEPIVDLWILHRPESRRPEPRLAYRVQLERLDGTERTEAPVVFMDAETGEELWRYNNLQTGSGPTYYSGTVTINTYLKSANNYYMEDLTRKMGTFTYRNTTTSAYRYFRTNDVWNAAEEKAGVEAHYGAAKTYDYFKTAHGRDGIDGAGGPGNLKAANNTTPLVTSLVHYSTKFNNAFWYSSKMVYGDGDGTLFGPLVSLDICGHEMTHGITERTAKLIYSGESGALNESISDVFGAMVERAAKGESANTWKVGEEVFTPAKAGDALRFMDNPHLATNNNFTPDDDPDHYTERYTGASDNGGVHINSGIANKAFYLVAKGGAHHLGGSMADIGQPNGIGPDKAAAIWYKALTAFMTANTGFAEARTATINAATAIHGMGSPEVDAVTQAWFLVGVGTAPPNVCVHDVCAAGTFMKRGCDACVTKICGVDPFCCDTSWDSLCVDQAKSGCGKCNGTCGDGTVKGTEACDLGTKNADVLSACTTQCTTTGLIAYFNASNVRGNDAAVVNGAPIAQWFDLASTKHAVQPSAGRQPTYNATAIKGKPALQFDGVDDVLVVPLDINQTKYANLTVVAVLQNAVGNPNVYAGVWGNDNGNFDRFLISGGFGGYAKGIANGSATIDVPGIAAEGTPLIVIATMRNGAGANTSTVHMNGALAATYTENHPDTGDSVMSIGNLNGMGNAAFTFDGFISVIAVYDHALTAVERDAVQAKLAAIYL